MTVHPGYDGIESGPTVTSPEAIRQFVARLADIVNRLNSGKANFWVEVTLAAGAASTVVTDARLSYFSAALFDPMTANAAAELAAGTLYVTQANRLNGSWTLTHANAGSTDRTFRMCLLA